MNWEYRTITLDTGGFSGGKVDENKLERLLNDMGQQGWELVNAFDTNQTYGASRTIVGIFKKPRG